MVAREERKKKKKRKELESRRWKGSGRGRKHARKRETDERYRRRKTLIGGEKTEKGRQPNRQPGTRKKATVEEGQADEDSRRMELWKQKQKPVSLAQGCLPERVVPGPGAEATESSRASATWSAVS